MTSLLDRIGFLVALLVFVLYALTFDKAFSTDDDVYISYRYAQNVAHGYGLVFNPQDPPVEGYTNFLWVILLAGVAALGLDLAYAGPFLSFFFSMLILIFLALWAYRQKIFTRDFSMSMPVLFLVVSPSLALWSTTGMETPFFTWMCLCSVYVMSIEERNHQKGFLSGLCFALGALSRPEGILIAVCFIVFPWIFSIEKWTRLAAFAQRFFTFLIPVLAHFAFRKMYYEMWLPNTFYAKFPMDGSLLENGLVYFKSFLWQGGFLLFLLILLGLFVYPRIQGIRTVFITCIIYCAYTVWIGGDWMAAHRLYLPILPFMIMAASAVIMKIYCAGRVWGFLTGALVFINLSISGFLANRDFMEGSTILQELFHQQEPVDILKELGLHLKKISDPSKSELLAVVPAGKVPYYSDLKTIDMRGLCDRYIAGLPIPQNLKKPLTGHVKRDAEYILKHRPDYIVLTGAKLKEGVSKKFIPRMDGNLLDRWEITEFQEFKDCYEPVTVVMPRGDKDLFYFKRKTDC